MTQGETPLLPVVVDPHNIRCQHFLMLRWVLLCDYCSYYYHHLPKTFEHGRAINARIIVAAYYRDHCLLFRVCSIAELSFSFIITAPEGAAVVYTNISIIFFQSYINMSMGHARLICTQLYITHFVEGRVLQVPFFSKGLLYMVPLLLSLTTPFSVKETLMDFGYTYAPNLIHQGTFVITEICPHMATITPHRQNRNEVIHGTGLNPQHCKRVKNYTK
jgi:hypothetical protein